jgi:hypothetical protein
LFTANNPIKLAYQVRQLFFVLILLSASSINSNGQNISSHYTSSLQKKGTLYFILPKSGFEEGSTKNEFTYDITYLTSNDTVTVNFSYFDKLDRTFDSIVFVSSNKKFSSNVKKLFIETKKLKWHYRCTSKFLFNDIDGFFNQPEDPKIMLYTQQGIVELKMKTKTWKKQSAVVRKIIALIKLNR